ncbi:MAG: hypothetical protein NWQ38_00855 [Cellulophaga sp.]|nr:hypothetical protein [Cellulophaga sp.]
MEKTNQLNPNESLKIISQAISLTKENIKGQSFYFLWWGWIIAIAAFAHYFLETFSNTDKSYVPWMILVPIGWAGSIIYAKKKEKTKPYETYFELFLQYLWVVLGISFMISVFISLWLEVQPAIFVLLLAGIGTLVSGLIMKFKPLIVGGIFFFVFAVTCLFVDTTTILLFNALAIITGYLIPAYLLKNSD